MAELEIVGHLPGGDVRVLQEAAQLATKVAGQDWRVST